MDFSDEIFTEQVSRIVVKSWNEFIFETKCGLNLTQRKRLRDRCQFPSASALPRNTLKIRPRRPSTFTV